MTPENLKVIRKKLKLTQKQIAEIIEVSDKTWQQWETGKGSMHVAFFNLLKDRVKDRLNLEDLINQEVAEEGKQIFNTYAQNQITKDAENLA